MVGVVVAVAVEVVAARGRVGGSGSRNKCVLSACAPSDMYPQTDKSITLCITCHLNAIDFYGQWT